MDLMGIPTEPENPRGSGDSAQAPKASTGASLKPPPRTQDRTSHPFIIKHVQPSMPDCEQRTLRKDSKGGAVKSPDKRTTTRKPLGQTQDPWEDEHTQHTQPTSAQIGKQPKRPRPGKQHKQRRAKTKPNKLNPTPKRPTPPERQRRPRRRRWQRGSEQKCGKVKAHRWTCTCKARP